LAATDLARRDRAFYTTMSIIALLVVLAGFSPSFFLMAANTSARHLAPIYHIHGAMFALCMLFYINQNLLIARGKPATHMRLGQFGAVLGCIMIVMAFTVTIYAGKHGLGGPLSALPDKQQALAVSFFDMFVFAPLFVGELDRQLYLYLALIFAAPVYDLLTRKRIRPAYYFALVPCLLLLTSVRLRIGASEPWHQFATWLVS
jgi:hypothetical protein